MRRSRFKSETDLAKAVVTYLHDWKYEVYQEVIGCGGRCDIVGKQGKILWAIECKLSFGLPVIEQALNWRHRAHYVSVAVPSRPSNFGHDILRSYGLGCLLVRGEENIDEVQRPRLNRRIHPIKLHEEQKTFCDAGSNQGGHWTPFKQTVKNLISEVKRHPGIEFKALIKDLQHHYSSNGSAASCLRSFIGGDVIPELEIRTIDRKLCVFLSEAKDEADRKTI